MPKNSASYPEMVQHTVIGSSRSGAFLSELGLKPDQTFATNLIFVESRSAKEICDVVLFEACWRVHKKMLAEIKPKYIMCLGNGEALSAFSLVHRKAHGKEKEARSREFKSFVGTFRLDDGVDLTAKVLDCGIRATR